MSSIALSTKSMHAHHWETVEKWVGLYKVKGATGITNVLIGHGVALIKLWHAGKKLITFTSQTSCFQLQKSALGRNEECALCQYQMQKSFVHEKNDSLSVAEYVFYKESEKYIKISEYHDDDDDGDFSSTMNEDDDVKVGVAGAEKVSDSITDDKGEDSDGTPDESNFEEAFGVASAQYDDEDEEPTRLVLIWVQVLKCLLAIIYCVVWIHVWGW